DEGGGNRGFGGFGGIGFAGGGRNGGIGFAVGEEERPSVMVFVFDAVEFDGRRFSAFGNGAVIDSPEFAGDRMPIETDGVAEAAGDDFAMAAVAVGAEKGGAFGIVFEAGVATASDGNVEFIVQTEGDGAAG